MTDKPTADRPSEQPTFEAALERLEDIVHLLEDGRLGLNDAIERV